MMDNEIEIRDAIVDRLVDYDYAPDVGETIILKDDVWLSDIVEFIQERELLAKAKMTRVMLGETK